MADLEAKHAAEVAGCRADCESSVRQLRQQYRREMQQVSEPPHLHLCTGGSLHDDGYWCRLNLYTNWGMVQIMEKVHTYMCVFT